MINRHPVLLDFSKSVDAMVITHLLNIGSVSEYEALCSLLLYWIVLCTHCYRVNLETCTPSRTRSTRSPWATSSWGLGARIFIFFIFAIPYQQLEWSNNWLFWQNPFLKNNQNHNLTSTQLSEAVALQPSLIRIGLFTTHQPLHPPGTSIIQIYRDIKSV